MVCVIVDDRHTIYLANQEQISDPNRIYWGLRLRIPPADYVPPSTTAAATTLAP